MNGEGRYLVGVDIGGTFTDCAIIDAEGGITTGKVPTAPADLATGFFAAIDAAAGSLGLDAERVLASAAKLAHGTTAGTNALVTGRVARVALLTTRGHPDASRIMNDMGRALGASIEAQLDWSISSRPEPIVPRRQVFEITERVDYAVWSACGCALLDQQRRYEASTFLRTPFDLDALRTQLAPLERQARDYAELLGLGAGEYELERSGDLKYALQVFEVETPLPAGPVDDGWAGRLVAAFESAYADRFGPGTGYAAAGVTLTALRVVVRATGRTPALRRPPAATGAAAAPSGTRTVFWKEYDAAAETPIHDGPSLDAGARVTGPAVVEYPTTTVAVRPGQALSVHPAGHLVLDLEATA